MIMFNLIKNIAIINLFYYCYLVACVIQIFYQMAFIFFYVLKNYDNGG